MVNYKATMHSEEYTFRATIESTTAGYTMDFLASPAPSGKLMLSVSMELRIA